MVLNSKAELAAKSTRFSKIPYERVERWGILVGLATAMGLSCQLYRSMAGDWQAQEQTRWHVLELSMALLVLSVVACCYLCHKLQPTSRLSRTLTSVNSQLYLLLERPPSYDSVTRRSEPPPPYHTVFTV